MIEYVSKNEHGNCELKFKGETAEITQDVCDLISTVYAALLEKRNEVVAELDSGTLGIAQCPLHTYLNAGVAAGNQCLGCLRHINLKCKAGVGGVFHKGLAGEGFAGD